MEIDPAAAALGFPKFKYAWVERERRWLCATPPVGAITESLATTDLYITGTRLRLREARPLDGREIQRKLTRKANADPATCLLTTIYLSAPEYSLLAALPGCTLRKTRHRLTPTGGVVVSVDVFDGVLEGLVLAEAEFDTAEALAAFRDPDFTTREVTDDPRYRGGALAIHGRPGPE
jgi:CYTH domain-containing protein